jgi:hypothetical protein
MASRTLIDTALKIYKSLGGNTSKVLGTRTNVNFLGKGKSPELMVDMDINPDALGVLPKSKAVEELESAMGYLTSGKLNDLQANQLIKNMNTMKSVYDPAPAPANITDMVTGTRNLDQEGLMSLRSKVDDIDLPEGVALEDTILPRGVGVQRVPADEIVDDLPPPGSRGGPDDIAAPFTGAGLESLKKVQNFDRTIGDDLVNKVYDMAGVSKNAQPVARGNARDFLNTIKDLEDPEFPGGPTLSSVMELDDLKFMTEGGGGALGDPLLLVQKYFGPKVASSVSQLDGRDQIELFAKRLVRIKDVKGNTITDRNFDPTTADFDFADGGRVPFFRGKLVGKALGLAKKAAATASGGKQMGYGDIRKYGLEAEDISRLFRNVAMDKSLVGKEKTLYMQRLNQVLKNPDDFPDGIREIQQMLGIDPIGFKGGGLAEILEV